MAAAKTPRSDAVSAWDIPKKQKIELKPKVGLVLGDIVTINHLNYKVKKILNRGRLMIKPTNLREVI